MELNFDEPIILVGDGPVSKDALKAFKGMPVIAVDGGANALARFGMEFDYICGDMDSVVPLLLARTDLRQIIHLDDQEACDFEKTLKIITAPEIYAFGFMGGRMDHSIEALRMLSKFQDKSIELIGSQERAFVWQTGTHREMKIAERISFMSFGQTHANVSFGLKYPLDGLTISPSFMSLSNEADENEVAISYDGAPLVAIVEN